MLKDRRKKDSRWSLSQSFDVFSLFNFKRQKSCNVRKKRNIIFQCSDNRGGESLQWYQYQPVNKCFTFSEKFCSTEKNMNEKLYLHYQLFDFYIFKCKWVLFQMQHAEFFCIENFLSFFFFSNDTI